MVALSYDVPISTLTNNPQRKAREAMAAFRTPWVFTAERAVSSVAARGGLAPGERRRRDDRRAGRHSLRAGAGGARLHARPGQGADPAAGVGTDPAAYRAGGLHLLVSGSARSPGRNPASGVVYPPRPDAPRRGQGGQPYRLGHGRRPPQRATGGGLHRPRRSSPSAWSHPTRAISATGWWRRCGASWPCRARWTATPRR